MLSFKKLPHKGAVSGVNRRFFLFPDKKEESLFLFLFVLFYLIFKPLGAACGILFSQQGSNPHLLHGKCGVLTTGPPGMSLLCFKQNLKPMTYK